VSATTCGSTVRGTCSSSTGCGAGFGRIAGLSSAPHSIQKRALGEHLLPHSVQKFIDDFCCSMIISMLGIQYQISKLGILTTFFFFFKLFLFFKQSFSFS
jgi:hypothetical protein